MHAIVEIHTMAELEVALDAPSEMLGVNSRNLNTLEVDAIAFKELLPRIPTDVVRVAESGIFTPADVQYAVESGANAILVGEALVRAGDPELAVHHLLGRQ